MLDLDARVDFQEEELAAFVHQELDGPRPPVVRPLHQPNRGGTDLISERGVQAHRGRDFDDLLVPPLDRAVPLPEMDEPSLSIAQDLHLDVSRLPDQLLEIDGAPAE